MGVVINTGSRDELENEHGIAHMIEHVISKARANARLTM